MNFGINNKPISRLSGPTSISLVKPGKMEYARWKSKGIYLPIILLVSTDNSDVINQCPNCEPSNGCYPIYSPEFFTELSNVDIYTRATIDPQISPEKVVKEITNDMLLNTDLQYDTDYILTQKNKLCYYPELKRTHPDLFTQNCIGPNIRWHSIVNSSLINIQKAVDILSSVSSISYDYQLTHMINTIRSQLTSDDKSMISAMFTMLSQMVSLEDTVAQHTFIADIVQKNTDIQTMLSNVHIELRSTLIDSFYSYYIEYVLPNIKKEILEYTQEYKKNARDNTNIDFNSTTIDAIRKYILLIKNIVISDSNASPRLITKLVQTGRSMYGILTRLFTPLIDFLHDISFLLRIFTIKSPSFLSIGLVRNQMLYSYFTKVYPIRTWYTSVIPPKENGSRCVALSDVSLTEIYNELVSPPTRVVKKKKEKKEEEEKHVTNVTKENKESIFPYIMLLLLVIVILFISILKM